MSLAGKVVLITGASSGIGRAAALAFAKEGASIVIADIHEVGGRETVRSVQEHGGKAHFTAADVSRDSDVRKAVDEALAAFGRLDFAFNNAGIEGPLCVTSDYSETDWDRVVATNLKGVWLCMKYELAVMAPQNFGVFVNNSSIAGLVGFPNLCAYVAAKHGAISLTKTAALESATQSIRVNCICPGAIGTPMLERAEQANPQMIRAVAEAHPMKRLGTPEEIAQLALWLCKDATFVTGQVIVADGGCTVQ